MDHVRDLAARLWRARIDGGTLPREATDVLGGVGAAYSVQHEMATLAGLPRAGWKVGATNAAMQTLFGIDEPASAPMFQPFCFASPAELAVFPDQGASVECEFAFLFARDLPPRSQAYTRAEVLDAVEALVPAIEVVGCRFAGGFGELGGVRLVADMSGNSAFVAGPRTADWQAVDVKGQGVRLFVNEAFVVEGVGANALGDPLSVLEWTANHLSALGDAILAGEIITTGTCTGVTPVSAGDVAVADFGDLGRVEVRISNKSQQ